VREVDKLATIVDLDSKTSYFENAAEKYGLDKDAAEEMKEYAKYLVNIADGHAELSRELEVNADNVAMISVQIARMNKGIKALGEGYSEWQDIISNSTIGSWEHFEAITATKKALADTLNVEAGVIDDDFIRKYLKDIGKAAEGDEEAIEELKKNLGESLIEDLKARIPEVSNLADNINLALDSIGDVDIGMTVENEEFIRAANELVEKAKWSAD
jgi:uncharacterized phage infection (PIP) family protein YhgE